MPICWTKLDITRVTTGAQLFLNRPLWFLLTVTAMSCADAATPTQVAGTVTFVDVQSDAVGKVKTLLQRSARSFRASAAAPSQTHALQEISRPERFALVQPAAGLTLAADSLKHLLAAPLDMRKHQDIPGLASDARPEKLPSNVVAILYSIAHVDVAPPALARGQSELARLALAARSSPGNLRFDVWQQTDRPNHFELIGAWRTRAQFDLFVDGLVARQFRANVGPILGALYDERLYRLID
jgi:quinol monooxygenase YgiN